MLFNRKAHQLEFKKHTSVYISNKYKHVIIAPMSQNDSGILYEQDKCSTLNIPIDANELGKFIIDNLNLYSITDVNLSDHKGSNWPAFKQSKSNSVRAFEQDYIRISITGANEKNIILLISGLPYKDSELTINASISFYADKDEIGQKLLLVHQTCLTGKIF